MKSFLDQFVECKKSGQHGKGEFHSFKDHPGELPAFPNAKMRKAIKDGTWTGNETIACLRFGGECNSGHPKCKAMRILSKPA